MKYCEEYATLLDLFMDGELPPVEMERVQAHLETCPGCRGYVDDALAIRAGFPDVDDTVVPEGFAESVMERVREDAGKDAKIAELKQKSARRWVGMFAALAACCALVILARTGPGDVSGGRDSVSMETADTGGGAPAEYAMDTGGVEESDDAWNGLQMAMEPAAAPEETKEEAGTVQTEGETEARMAAVEMDCETAIDTVIAEDFEKAAASRSEYEEQADLPAAALPAASADIVYTAGGGEAALYLTAEEAGELLEGHTPVRETVLVLDDALAGPERWYELTGEEYRSLLEALGRPAETATAGAPLAAPVLVVVTGPFE